VHYWRICNRCTGYVAMTTAPRGIAIGARDNIPANARCQRVLALALCLVSFVFATELWRCGIHGAAIIKSDVIVDVSERDVVGVRSEDARCAADKRPLLPLLLLLLRSAAETQSVTT